MFCLHSFTSPLDGRPCVATIGFFDGVHQGHLHLLRQVRDEASRCGMLSLAVTFAEHPREVLDTDYRPALLSTLEEKLYFLKESGIDGCAVLHFTKEMSALTSRQFMERILRDSLNVRTLVVGYDHHFGSDRGRSFEDYCRFGDETGIKVLSSTPYYMGGTAVSSSHIRRLLLDGRVEEAASCLGRFYSLSGQVVEGRHIGRVIGFPTANLSPADKRLLVPKGGVYVAEAFVEGRAYRAMLNIGTRPTFSDDDRPSIEAHLLDFHGDLYGKRLTFRFLSRLRDERKFDNVEDLKHQLHADAHAAQVFIIS